MLRGVATGEVSREGLMALMLQACGERGYRGVDLDELAATSGAPTPTSWFRDEADCFAGGYASEGARLRRLLARARREGGAKREILEAALLGLSALIDERPAVAKSLFAEVHVVGGPAMRERARLLADLARLIDDAYRDDGILPPPPAGSAAFMVEVIETVAQRAAVEGDATVLTEAIPDLAAMLEELYGPARDSSATEFR